MHTIIAGGSGFIGQALTKHLVNLGHRITIIGRDTAKLSSTFANKTTNINWSNFNEQPHVWLQDADWVINLAGTNISDKRWCNRRKRDILTSRIETAGLLAREISHLKNPPTFFSASGIGIYGQHKASTDSQVYNETTPIDFNLAPTFLAKVARAWERATWPAHEAGARVINMRFGVVLAKHGGALAKIATSIRLGLGGKIGDGQQPLSWISLDDLVRAIVFTFEHKKIQGPVNFVAPEATTQLQLTKILGELFKRPTVVPMPSWLLKLILGEMADELILHGQNVTPDALTSAGFKFEYPRIDSALQHIYGAANT